MTHTVAADCVQSSSLEVPSPVWAGQRGLYCFRLTSDEAVERTVVLHARGDHADRVTFSHYKAYGFQQTLVAKVRARGCSDCVWASIEAENECATELISNALSTDADISLSYNAVSTWDQRVDPYPLYRSDMTDRFSSTFAERGAVQCLYRYDPLTDKRTLDAHSPLASQRDKCRIERWVDPQDPDFWAGPQQGDDDPYEPYAPTVNVLKPKCFIGGRDINLPYPMTWGDGAPGYSDTLRILIPPDVFLHRLYCPWGVVSHNGPLLYQRSVYTLQLDGLQYSIENLMPRFLQRGEFVYWQGDCRLVFLPSGSNLNTWIPWNALYEHNKDVVCHYITTYAPSVLNDFALNYSMMGLS